MMNQTARVHAEPHCLFFLDPLGLAICLHTSSGGKRRRACFFFLLFFILGWRGEEEKEERRVKVERWDLDNCELEFGGGVVKGETVGDKNMGGFPKSVKDDR